MITKEKIQSLLKDQQEREKEYENSLKLPYSSGIVKIGREKSLIYYQGRVELLKELLEIK